MAYFGAALGGALQGYNQGIQQGIQNRAMMVGLAGELQRQRLINQQLKDQQDAANALAAYYGASVPTGPAPAPAPGQPSVPARSTPAGMSPTTSQLAFGTPAFATRNQPATAPAAQGVGPMGIAPYRSMQDIVREVQSRTPGISPQATLAAAGRIFQGEQSAQANALRTYQVLGQMQEHADNLAFRIDEAKARELNQQASLGERRQAHQDLLDLRREEMRTRQVLAGLQNGAIVHTVTGQGASGQPTIFGVTRSGRTVDLGISPASFRQVNAPGQSEVAAAKGLMGNDPLLGKLSGPDSDAAAFGLASAARAYRASHPGVDAQAAMVAVIPEIRGRVKVTPGRLWGSNYAYEAGTAAMPSPDPATPQSQSYKTPDDVKSAVQAGRITRDEGLRILRSQFGYQ